MKVSFKTKAESNREQEEAFLQLSPIERIHSFINFMLYTQDFPNQAASKKPNNFHIKLLSTKR